MIKYALLLPPYLQINKFCSQSSYFKSIMDTRRVTSVGRHTDQPIEICILLVNDDLICRNIVMDMLQNCNHEAYNFGNAMDALHVISERRGKVELVITNVERTDANRFGIIEYIEKEYKLRVALMRPDGNLKILTQNIESGVTVYVVKCSSIIDIKDLWENALTREKGKMVAKEEVDGKGRESILEKSINSAVSERTRVQRKRKKSENEETSEENQSSKDDTCAEKKKRVQWTNDMHRKFLEAVAQLGPGTVVPKKITQLMNIPGLTREHVASHLQKHRQNLRKTQTSPCSFYGRTSINDVKGPCFPLSHTSPMSFGFQQGSRKTLSVPASSRCCFNTEASTSMSRNTPALTFSINSQRKLQFSYTKQKFRVYDDQTKSVVSFENGRSSRNTNQSAASSSVDASFVGLQLAHDGKSVEIGQMGIPARCSVKRQVVSSASGIYGVNNSFQYPLAFDTDPTETFEQYASQSSFSSQQQSYLPPLETIENEDSDCYLSLPADFTPQHLPQLVDDEIGDKNLYQCPSLPISFAATPEALEGNGISDQYPLLQYPPTQFEAQENVNSDIDPSFFVECSTVTPPLQNECLVQEAYVPPLELHELDCFGVDEDINILVENATRSLCYEDIENILSNHEH